MHDMSYEQFFRAAIASSRGIEPATVSAVEIEAVEEVVRMSQRSGTLCHLSAAELTHESNLAVEVVLEIARRQDPAWRAAYGPGRPA